METIDTLKNGYKIIQNSEKFKFGIDAILLSYFAVNHIKKENSVFDLGTGNGIIPLMLAKSEAKLITGIEIQKDNVDIANKSVELNRLEEKIKIVQGDIKLIDKYFSKHSYDIVLTNPPYMIYNHGKENPSEAKSIARHEVLCNLEDIIKATDFLLKPYGKFFMIHKPFRLPEIFTSLIKYKIEPKRMQLICPFSTKEPNLVLIEARKNSKPELKIEENLVVYQTAGIYTEKINQIYSSFMYYRKIGVGKK